MNEQEENDEPVDSFEEADVLSSDLDDGTKEIVYRIDDQEPEVVAKTQTLTLARALTYKKRVAERLRQIETDIQANNSIASGQVREADVIALIEERRRLVNHMIDLKIAIQDANGPIRQCILELSEMKAENDFFRSVPTTHGARQNQYAYEPMQSAAIIYDAVIRKAEVDGLVKRNNTRIDLIQDEIEAHNHSTTITIEDIGLRS